MPREAGGLPRPLAGDGPRYHSCHVVRELAEAEIRTEKLERVNTHLYETGGMRRVHLRGHNNILKRLLIHVGALNLGLLMRTIWGVGTPRGLQGRQCRTDFGHRFVLLRPRVWSLQQETSSHGAPEVCFRAGQLPIHQIGCCRTSPPLQRIASFPTQAASGHSKPSEFISCSESGPPVAAAHRR